MTRIREEEEVAIVLGDVSYVLTRCCRARLIGCNCVVIVVTHQLFIWNVIIYSLSIVIDFANHIPIVIGPCCLCSCTDL